MRPGDVLSIVFNLRDGSVFSDVLAELASTELRVGVQVRGFRGRRRTRGRESFINESFVADVPEPAPLPAAAVGLLVIALARGRRGH